MLNFDSDEEMREQYIVNGEEELQDSEVKVVSIVTDFLHKFDLVRGDSFFIVGTLNSGEKKRILITGAYGRENLVDLLIQASKGHEGVKGALDLIVLSKVVDFIEMVEKEPYKKPK